MLAAFAKAIGQLPTREFRAIVWRSVVLSVVVFVLLGALLWWALSSIVFFGGWGGWFSWLADGANWAAGWAVGLAGWASFSWLSWLLFPAVVSMFVGFFLEDVASAVETRHYPRDAAGTNLPLARALWVAAKFTVLLVVLNLLILPLYLVPFFIPIVNPFVFYGLNGYLLSREYFDLVALRHHDEEVVYLLRRRYRWRIFAAGVVIAFLLTVPVVNLVASIVGVAAMVHIYKSVSPAAAKYTAT